MADDFDSGILKELTEATKLLSKVSKELNRTMKGMTDSTEKSVRRIKKTTDESHRKSDEQNKKDEESTKKQAKMSKTQSDRQTVNTMKHLQQKNRIELSHANLLERQFLRTSSRQHGNVMGFMQMIGRQSSMIGGASELSELIQLKKSGRVFNKDENIAYNRLTKEGAGESPLMPLFTMFDKYFGTGSKWDKFFQGHGKLAAGVIGGGAAGLGATAVMKGVQMAIEASPMLQQMLKLWKFGIMMVLRPIGDFFGFVMRPVMMMLLRKFIIPWYTKMLPVMIKWGELLGGTVVDFLSNPQKYLEETGETLEEKGRTSFVPSGSYIIDPVTGNLIPNPKEKLDVLSTNFEAAVDIAIGGLMRFGAFLLDPTTFISPPAGATPDAAEGGIGIDSEGYKELDDNMASLAEQFRELQKEVEKTKNGWGGDEGLPDYVNPIETGASTELTPAQKDAQLMMTNPAQWQQQQNMKAQREGIYNDPITIPVDRMAENIQKAKTIEDAYTKYKENNTSVSARGQTGGVGLMDKNGDGKIDYMDYMANGGIIDEPILGKGLRTGKGYMMGEAGKEAVIPLNKTGGTNITVNIQNMSASQQDLNALRSVILSVVQEANTRRGRI
jgi:hypothetical protein